MSSIFLLGAALLVFASGCVPAVQPNANNPIARVAVLPMSNHTNDLDGPVFMRTAFNNVVPSRFYETVDLKVIDDTLNEKLGVTLGDQLDYTNPGAGAPEPVKVGETLAVDGLFYGTLEEFKQIITGVYNKRTAKASFKLVNAKTGETVWEQVADQSNSEFNLSVSGALQAIVKQVATTALTKAFKANPLAQETNMVVDKLRRTVPPGPVAGAATAGRKK